MVRISTKALRDMKDTYSLRIKRSRDTIESKLKGDKREIKNEHYDKLCIEINKLLKTHNIDAATISHEITGWGEKQLKIIINAVDPNISMINKLASKIDKRRKESCERHKKMLRDLDDWELKCLETNEITPFTNLPDPIKDDIECSVD